MTHEGPPRPIPPANGPDGDSIDSIGQDLLQYVKDVEEERKKEAGAIPRDVFGLVSLLPRRALAIGLAFALMGMASLTTYVFTLRSARSEEDGAALRILVTQVIPRIQEQVAVLQTDVAGLRGQSDRTDRELSLLRQDVKDTKAATARIEGKLDRMR